MARAHVAPVLTVDNLEKSLAFYVALGFRERAGAKLAAERTSVELHGALFHLVHGPRARAPEGVVLRVTVPDLQRLHAAAMRLGAMVEGAPEGAFRVEDPDGHVLEFAKERPRAKPRPRRALRKKRKRRR